MINVVRAEFTRDPRDPPSACWCCRKFLRGNDDCAVLKREAGIVKARGRAFHKEGMR